VPQRKLLRVVSFCVLTCHAQRGFGLLLSREIKLAVAFETGLKSADEFGDDLFVFLVAVDRNRRSTQRCLRLSAPACPGTGLKR
jgi:hypothetical protein